MIIRKTTVEDLPTLLDIFAKARIYMAQHGNPHQWINRPTKEDILRDIATGNSYVCCEDQRIIGTFAYLPGPDPTYATIYDGAWPDNKPYGVIHRIAGTPGARGVAKAVFNWALHQCPRLRIDTHADNGIMQSLLRKQGFVFCGTILLENGDPRLAFYKSENKDCNS